MKAHSLAASSILVCWSLVSVLTHAQAAGVSSEISVSDPRPLAQAIREIEKLTGLAITYEDPILQNPFDVIDMTAAVAKQPGMPIILPRGGTFRFQWAAASSGDRENVGRSLAGLLTTYDRAGYPGRFRLFDDGKMFHVIPAFIRDKAGEDMPVPSILDVEVVIGKPEGQALEVITSILSSLAERTGRKVWLGSVPVNLLTSRVNILPVRQVARSALGRAIDGVEQTLSWQLLYDIGQDLYMLNVYPVPKAGL